MPSVAVFASWRILFLPEISSSWFSRLLLVAPRAPITVGTALTLMFHILCVILKLQSFFNSSFVCFFFKICFLCIPSFKSRPFLAQAKRAGVTCLIFPRDNQRDFNDLAEYIRKGVEAHFVTDYSQIYDIAFRQPEPQQAEVA